MCVVNSKYQVSCLIITIRIGQSIVLDDFSELRTCSRYYWPAYSRELSITLRLQVEHAIHGVLTFLSGNLKSLLTSMLRIQILLLPGMSPVCQHYVFPAFLFRKILAQVEPAQLSRNVEVLPYQTGEETCSAELSRVSPSSWQALLHNQMDANHHPGQYPRVCGHPKPLIVHLLSLQQPVNLSEYSILVSIYGIHSTTKNIKDPDVEHWVDWVSKAKHCITDVS